MSKILSKELKLQTLLLYRNILRIHTYKLNQDMRVFGDYFVKSEFTLNYKQADEHQIKLFNKQWTDYLNTLKHMKDITSVNYEASDKLLNTKMDIDQKKSLDDIKNIIVSKE
jgi:hypothetical protein